MHDSKGRLVEVGATLKFKAYDPGQQAQRQFVGLVTGVFAGSETCNATVCRPVFGGTLTETVTLKETELVLDASGGDPEPAQG
jgi:hypothetical protein